MGELEISRPLDHVPEADLADRRWSSAFLLVRAFGEPIGVLELPMPEGGISSTTLGAEVSRTFGVDLADLPDSPFVEAHRRARQFGPTITAVICTRGRPEGLSLSLASLTNQDYPRLEIVVVDNAPVDDLNRDVVQKATADATGPIRYVVEERPGLSWARNAALTAAETDVVAFIDDDERADRMWATEIARAFLEHPEAGAVSGMVLPAEIESPAQEWFERYGGHRKGRGFAPTTFSPATRQEQSPLYPLPQYGSGANMAVSKAAIRELGGFNPALGAGTRTMGGEDTAALCLLLYGGGTVVYRPSALVWHFHRRTFDDLRKMLHGYGRGLAAFYASVVLSNPGAIFHLLRIAPRAAHDFRASDGPRLGEIGTHFPPELLSAMRSGLLQGVPAYCGALWDARQLRRSGIPA
jgi:glycosyltransferase involved in cell wall biosynthesis